MSIRILCVDDDVNVLQGFQRNLRNRYKLDTAISGSDALELMEKQGPYAVIVSDMKMPGMDGAQFLEKARSKCPDSVRVMLTGNADQKTAVEAVNVGQIFQFINKPCSPEMLIQAIDNGIHKYQIVRAEKELLENTLKGSVNILSDVLSMIEPQAFGRGQVLKEYMRTFTGHLKIPLTWELEVAAMLSPLGFATIPKEILTKQRNGEPLSGKEKDLISRIPNIGARLLSNIPRLEDVARIILYQNNAFDGTGFPTDNVSGEDLPIGSRILKVLSDLLELENHKLPKFKALEKMQMQSGIYDPRVMDAAFACFDIYLPQSTSSSQEPLSITFSNLQPGHFLSRDIVTIDDTLILPAGTTISPTLIEKLRNFAQLTGIKEPIYVAPHSFQLEKNQIDAA